MTREHRLYLLVLVMVLAFTEVCAANSQITRFRILVPREAEILIDGERTTAKGMERWFDTPTLLPGRVYKYHIRVRHDGKEVTREVRFEPGKTVELDFRPEFRKPEVQPEQINPLRPYRRIRPEDMPLRRTYT